MTWHIPGPRALAALLHILEVEDDLSISHLVLEYRVAL